MNSRIYTQIFQILKNLLFILTNLFRIKTPTPESVAKRDKKQIFDEIQESDCSDRLKRLVGCFVIDTETRQTTISRDRQQELTAFIASESFREDKDKRDYYKEFALCLSKHKKINEESVQQLYIELQTIAQKEDSSAILLVANAYVKCNNLIITNMKHFDDLMREH